jgi:hypothetical protein
MTLPLRRFASSLGVLTLVGVVVALLAAPAAAVPLPYGDDFSSSAGPEWNFSPSANWSVGGGTLNLTSSATTLGASVVPDPGTIDGGFRMDVTWQASSFGGNSDLGFGAFSDSPAYSLGSPIDAHYLADLKASGGMRILRIEEDPASPGSLLVGTLIEVPTGTFSFDTAETYTMTLDVLPTVGTNQIRFTIDDPSRGGPLTMGVTDDTLLTGTYHGIRARPSGAPVNAAFDNFSIVPQPGQTVMNFDMGSGGSIYEGVAGSLDAAGTGAVWIQNVAAGNNWITQDSLGNPVSGVSVWIEPADNFGGTPTRGSAWQLDSDITGDENSLQGDLIWVTQEGLDYDANNGGNGAYDLEVVGLDPNGIYDIYVYGGSQYGTVVTLGDETYEMTGHKSVAPGYDPGDPNWDPAAWDRDADLAWAEGFQYVSFNGLTGSSSYAMQATLPDGAATGARLAVSGVQIVQTGVIPEPSTLVLLVIGAMALLVRRR